MELKSLENNKVVMNHHHKKKTFNVRPGQTFNLSCDFFGIRVASILLRPGDFIKVRCRGRTAIVFNSFFRFNRGVINLRPGEFVSFFGGFKRRKRKKFK